MISYLLPWLYRTPGTDSIPQIPQGVDPKQEDADLQKSVSSLLRQYETPGKAPLSARVDPLSLQRAGPNGINIREAWKLGAFLAVKATEITREFVSHHVWGPRKKSWGIEMTMITSILRNAGAQSNLTDVVTLRTLMHVAGWMPVPSDAIVTPVTFTVRRRGLRGFLAAYDASENGRRELQGEWVVGKRVWQRLQAEFRAARASERTASRSQRGKPLKLKERVILYLHGGAYYVFSAATHRVITIPLSKYTETRVFAINYRLAPETRFPGPLHDAVLAYLRLTQDLKIHESNIVVAGDSAGGGLALALLMYLRDNDYPMPAGAILMSPWVDLTMSCDSWDSNAAFDVVPFPPDPADHLNPVSCYLGPEGLEKFLTHPYASPLFGNMQGLPPLLVQAGDAEVLRDEITLLAHKATLAGVSIQHELYEDAVHVFQMFPFLEATHKSFSSARHFVRDLLPLHQTRSPAQLEVSVERKIDNEIRSERSRLVSGIGEVEKPDQSAFELVDSDEDAAGSDDSISSSEKPHDRSTNTHDHYNKISSQHGAVMSNSQLSVQDVSVAAKPASRRRTTISHTWSSIDKLPINMLPPAPVMTLPTKSLGRHTGLRPLTVMTSSQVAPRPTIRSRDRVRSHPDIKQLCNDWAAKGPANETTLHSPA